MAMPEPSVFFILHSFHRCSASLLCFSSASAVRLLSLYNLQKQIAPSDGDVERENGEDVSLGGRTGWPVLFPLRKKAKSCWYYCYNTKNSTAQGSADFVGDFKVDLLCCIVHCLP